MYEEHRDSNEENRASGTSATNQFRIERIRFKTPNNLGANGDPQFQVLSRLSKQGELIIQIYNPHAPSLLAPSPHASPPEPTAPPSPSSPSQNKVHGPANKVRG